MNFLVIIAIILAFGPVVFDLAVTGRAVSRPTRTSTTDWALTQFYTLHMGEPSLAIPPTGLVGAVLVTPDHNNQDSAVSIWTIYRVTTRRALANIGTFVTNSNRRGLDRQWRYMRGWWRHNSGRVIEEALIVYLYSLPFLAVILTIWRKRVLCQRRLEAKRSANLIQPSPILASSITIRSLVRTDIIQPTQRNVHSSSCANIVAIGGAPAPSLDQLPHHLPFDFRRYLIVSTPTKSLARSIPQWILGASTEYTFGIGGASAPVSHRLARSLLFDSRTSVLVSKPTEDLARLIGRQLLGAPTTCTGAVTVFEELRSGQEQVPGALTTSREIVSVSTAHDSGPKGSNSQRIILITLLVLPGGFVIIHYEAVDDLAFWTIAVILNPGARSSSAVSRRADNIYRVVPKRTVTVPTRGLIEAGSPQSDVLSICSSTPRRLFRPNSLGLPRALLPPKLVRRGGEPLPAHERVAQPSISPRRRPGSVSSFFTSIHSVEGVLVMACCSTSNGLHWSIQFYPFQHYHISQHTDNDHDKEELIQADVDIPLPDSRPESPEFHGPDPSTHSLDLHQHIAALFRQHLNLRAMLVRPLLPGEARAIRAELRPRLGSLGERARERRGLPPLPPVATELEGQVSEQEVVEQVHEEGVGGQVHEEEADGQVPEEGPEGQVDVGEVNGQGDEEVGGHGNEEADGQVNGDEVGVPRKRRGPRHGGKKTRTRKHKHQTDKEEEADPAREH